MFYSILSSFVIFAEALDPPCRPASACLSEEHAGYFVFGFARHPVAKFESGVQQAWLQSEELKRFSADELLAQQLQSGFFLNEHLQPSHYRFSGLTHLGTPVQMDFVGKVEAMEEDMQRAARTHCRRVLHRHQPDGNKEEQAADVTNVRPKRIRGVENASAGPRHAMS